MAEKEDEEEGGGGRRREEEEEGGGGGGKDNLEDKVVCPYRLYTEQGLVFTSPSDL